jgi:Flp pilus assembly protein TadD
MHETDPRKAVNLLRRRLLKTPRDLDALVALSAYLADLGQDKEAETLARRAHRISPAAPEVLRVLGRLLQLQGRYDDALAIADAALAVNPALGAAWQMRGDALANAGRQREALEAYANALSDQATAFETFVRLGKIHRVLGETDQALASFDQAARLRPDSAVPPYERGLLRLANGDFADGWRDYDARWRTEELTHTRGYVPTQLIPLLRIAPTKADLVGQRVLLIGDQGIGDQVMFASMLPDLRRVAKSVVCLCEPRLMRVLGNAFPDISFVHPSGAQVDSDSVDVLLAMSSLGAAFRPTATDFPGKAYLKAQQDGASRWAARLGDRRAGLRIGLSWRGGVPQTGRAERSIDLAALRPLLETPGCEFVSLQYDVRARARQPDPAPARLRPLADRQRQPRRRPGPGRPGQGPGLARLLQPGTNMKAWTFMILRNVFYSEKRRSWRSCAAGPGSRRADPGVRVQPDRGPGAGRDAPGPGHAAARPARGPDPDRRRGHVLRGSQRSHRRGAGHHQEPGQPGSRPPGPDLRQGQITRTTSRPTPPWPRSSGRSTTIAWRAARSFARRPGAVGEKDGPGPLHPRVRLV